MNTQSVQCANVERVDRYAEKFHMGFSIVIIISFWPEAQLSCQMAAVGFAVRLIEAHCNHKN